MDTTGNDLFSQLTPEQLASLLQGGTLQDQGGLLAQQLEQLLGQGQQHREYSTPIGAGLGGIAEALDGTATAFHAKALRGDQQKNLDAQGKLMGEFGQLLRGPQAQATPNQPANPSEMSSTWGVDLSQQPTAGAMPHEPAMDRTQLNQPQDPSAIVNDGSDGWGLDLSDPKQLAAITKSLRGKPDEPVKVAQSIHPSMRSRRNSSIEQDQFSPFGF